MFLSERRFKRPSSNAALRSSNLATNSIRQSGYLPLTAFVAFELALAGRWPVLVTVTTTCSFLALSSLAHRWVASTAPAMGLPARNHL
jgi:hypothetical protein